ncbi:16S rRNA (cytidine(1402)-2'-O)-methyltransferase [Xylella taiwanensis]|uniref:Ribosomal RNA small subunit methyltransferase I n=1 Tax=Xylella taiwanensis TaxID=1444770 RepID=Z9JM06_9GAMM|nr:16S rRNA (cytidine(1402)-2'-O)-methyltransferase [Xylella taiwanensis]AXI84080.1 tetrapyrrole methylase [Xylella taiwanensis]EWS79003.1 16S rRNA methyltransferase [Xylella taiwanensis]MCD8457191.1 16S rRNA (cytidine(1402)-2'-O)-methyltransferase [Xylella taiwanensis]MCD8459600.1 16S rRNA (cytidine(1402)-2'-O)-methyltransferase [Xylella taiwanensis]MCD8461533.1 16S rRNA (cytidine(1402)-2'-O)-methyltransferase [Xylella taiwanensis]
MSTPGTLHIVATPIGNLGDLSPRAQHILRTVAMICAEDTRHTRQLLAHFAIERPLLALHAHNEDTLAERIVTRLTGGESLALVSDAGTPLISDPGFLLVRAARAAGIRVTPVPGPSALIAALSVCGLPSDRFTFEGFLPAKPAARRERLTQLAHEPRTLIFYEASHRIAACLTDLATIFGGMRAAVIARELTKVFETVLDGTLDTLQTQVANDDHQRKGEFVVIVQGAADQATARIAEGRRVYTLLKAHLPPSGAAKLAAEITGAPRKALYGG